MQLLYSNILPLGIEEDQKTIIDAFHEQLQLADRVEIAVGYTSYASLEELDNLIDAYAIHQVCLDLEVVVSCHTAESQNQDCCHCTHIGFCRCCFLRINGSFLVYILIICFIQHYL